MIHNSFSQSRNYRSQKWVKFSAVLAPCVPAFFASEELSRRFVSASSLQKPPESSPVSALWAFDISSRHRLDFLFLFSNNLDFGTCLMFNFFRPCNGGLGRLDETTLFTNKNGIRLLLLEPQTCSTFWTEFRLASHHQSKSC